MVQAMNRYWVSWWESSDDLPLRVGSSLTANVLGVWDSGYRDVSGGQSSACALVEAKNEDAVRAEIEFLQTVVEWRFIVVAAADWTPGDRFPMPR